MHVAVLGMNHKTACVESREQVALAEDGCRALVQNLMKDAAVREAIAISTCNRTEIYLSGERLPMRDVGLDHLCSAVAACRQDLEDAVYYLEDREAVDHLFSVASSLDSMVIGEAQILHQLKSAYTLAKEIGATSVVLNNLLRRSFKVGKRVRTETRIGESPVSIASVSVDLACNVFGELAGHSVLVIGAGEMAELVVTHLRGHGVGRILLTNRTMKRAVELADQFGAEAVDFTYLADHLTVADIVISSTASPEPVIGRAMVEEVMGRRGNRPVLLIDIAVPRDIEAAVNEVHNAYLYDIDDLQDVVNCNLGDRQREAVKAWAIVKEEVQAFQEWLSSLSVVPTLVAFRRWATAVKDQELRRYLARMPNLSPEEQNKVSALAHSIVNKLVHPPTERIRQLPDEKERYRFAESLQRLFGLNGLCEDTFPLPEGPETESPPAGTDR